LDLKGGGFLPLKKSEIQLQFEKMSYFVMAFSCELEKISTKNNKIFACGAKRAKMSEYKQKNAPKAQKIANWTVILRFFGVPNPPKNVGFSKTAS